MRRISMILMAFALVLTMTQCKKNEETNQDETVIITLDVKQSNGAKVDVDPTIGTVDFVTGDKVYVGSGGKYVGFLTHNGTNFVGNITDPTEGQPLQFYFLGNVIPQETLGAGTTETCSVVISDQTEHLPVISCAPSFENYVSGVTAYTGHLLNKCALVKFNVTTPSNSPICITGMNNKVTVDFSQNTVTPSMDGEGVIKLPAGGGENVEKWAILLQQEALEEGEEGTAYSEDGAYTGVRPEIPVIIENGYLADGIITISVGEAPIGAINGLFSVSETKQVYFSKGNLQYRATSHSWRFAENQWSTIGLDNANISPVYDSWIDLFGWGTSGYYDSSDPYNLYYQPWSTSTSTVNTSYNYYGYGPSTNMTSPNLTGGSANYDWGVYNSISNGGNATNQWRTLSIQEWRYIFNTRSTTSGIRYAKGQVGGVNGVILLPDNWGNNTYVLYDTNMTDANFSSNIMTVSQWELLEVSGAIFLPTTGYRNGTTVSNVDSYGYYWSGSASTGSSNGFYSMGLLFHDSQLYTNYSGNRCYGHSVRLVKNYNP